MLDPDNIVANLAPGLPVVPKVEVYAETASTNDIAWRLGQDGVGEGRVIFAESQTKGRGTRGRAWHSSVGKGLWFSVLLRPEFPVADWTRITPAMAVAAAQTVERATGRPAGIKWANDIHLGGRKLCGILAEASLTGPQRYMVVGCGLNVLQSPEDFPPDLRESATSLSMETSAQIDREVIAGHFISAILTAYAACASDEGFARILRDYRARNLLLGKEVTVETGSETRQGTVTGIGESGQLQLEGDDGPWETSAGTVRLV